MKKIKKVLDIVNSLCYTIQHKRKTKKGTHKMNKKTTVEKYYDIIDGITSVKTGDSVGDIDPYIDELLSWTDNDDLTYDDIDSFKLEDDILKSMSDYEREIGYKKLHEYTETEIEDMYWDFRLGNSNRDEIREKIFGDVCEIAEQWDCRMYTKENFNPEKYIINE